MGNANNGFCVGSLRVSGGSGLLFCSRLIVEQFRDTLKKLKKSKRSLLKFQQNSVYPDPAEQLGTSQKCTTKEKHEYNWKEKMVNFTLRYFNSHNFHRRSHHRYYRSLPILHKRSDEFFLDITRHYYPRTNRLLRSICHEILPEYHRNPRFLYTFYDNAICPSHFFHILF